MATKKRATAEPKKKRNTNLVMVSLSEEERASLDALAAEHGVPNSRIVAAGIMLLKTSRSAPRAIAEATERVRIGRPPKTD